MISLKEQRLEVLPEQIQQITTFANLTHKTFNDDLGHGVLATDIFKNTVPHMSFSTIFQSVDYSIDNSSLRLRTRKGWFTDTAKLSIRRLGKNPDQSPLPKTVITFDLEEGKPSSLRKVKRITNYFDKLTNGDKTATLWPPKPKRTR